MFTGLAWITSFLFFWLMLDGVFVCRNRRLAASIVGAYGLLLAVSLSALSHLNMGSMYLVCLPYVFLGLELAISSSSKAGRQHVAASFRDIYLLTHDHLMIRLTSARYGKQLAKHRELTLLRVVRVMTVFLVICSLFLGISSKLTNGDSQTYNIARVFSSYMSGELFLSSSTIPTQAFHVYGHDYLFVSDIILNRVHAYGFLGWVEFGLVLVLTDIVCELSESRGIECRRLARGNINGRMWTRLAMLSMPILFFQSTIPKNDLGVGVLTLTLLIFLWRQDNGSEMYGCSLQFRERRESLLFKIVAYGLLLGNSLSLLATFKAYGIACWIIVVLLVVSSPRQFRLMNWQKLHNYLDDVEGERRVELHQRYVVVAAVLAIVFAIDLAWQLTFYSHISDNWSDEYKLFKSVHSFGTLGASLGAFPVNLARILLESLINLPLPVVFKAGNMIRFLGGNENMVAANNYEFGGELNEDSAWPGAMFSLLTVFACVRLIKGVAGMKDYNIRSLVQSFNRFVEGHGLSACSYMAGCILFIALVFVLPWQPWWGRFMLVPSLLMTPLLGRMFAKTGVNR